MKTKLILCLLSLFTLSAMAQHNGPIRRPSKQSVQSVPPKKKPQRPSKRTVPSNGNTRRPNKQNTPGTDANRAKPLERLTVTVNGVSFNMIKVKGGTFRMGATSEQGSDAESDEKPVHEVTLTNDYYMGETEVTQALWRAVMGTNPSYFKKGGLYPVEGVSWDDCITFIDRLNSLTGRHFRLPSEAEWEYAARGGNRSRGFKYSGSNDVASVAWYGGNSGSSTHEVGTRQSNELGLYDMSGNVSEWCADWCGKYSGGSQTNPAGASSGSYRVRRGGSWNFIARGCRAPNRIDFTRDDSYSFLGLRLAL